MVIDIAFVLVILFAIVKGFSRGFIVAVFSLISYIIGLAAALKLSVIVVAQFENASPVAGKWLSFLSFFLVFVAVVLLIQLGARAIRGVARAMMLGWADRIGGILIYFITYTIIFSVILFFAEKLLLKPSAKETSVVYGFVSPWGPRVIDNLGKIVPVFKDLFLKLQIFFDGIAHHIPS